MPSTKSPHGRVGSVESPRPNRKKSRDDLKRKSSKKCPSSLGKAVSHRFDIVGPVAGALRVSDDLWSSMKGGTNAAVFFAHRPSLGLLRKSSDVLILSCSSETNSQGMTLLTAAAANARGNVFLVGFAFINGKPNGYKFALGALKRFYDEHNVSHPTLAMTDTTLPCIGAVQEFFPAINHIVDDSSRTIVTIACRQFSPSRRERFEGLWDEILQAQDEYEYYTKLTELRLAFSEKYPCAVSYLLNDWLIPHHPKLVSYCINQHPHYTSIQARLKTVVAYTSKHTSATMTVLEAFEALSSGLGGQLERLTPRPTKSVLKTSKSSAAVYTVKNIKRVRFALSKSEESGARAKGVPVSLKDLHQLSSSQSTFEDSDEEEEVGPTGEPPKKKLTISPNEQSTFLPRDHKVRPWKRRVSLQRKPSLPSDVLQGLLAVSPNAFYS